MANYIITFVNDDNITILQQGEVEEGVLPIYNGETPTKRETAQYTYTFAGWSPEITEAIEDTTYVAVYITNKKSFINFSTNEQYHKYIDDNVPIGIEKINKTTIEKLYEELQKEIIQRGGYQSICDFSPESLETRQQNPILPIGNDEEKAFIRHFNKAMLTRPYIEENGSNLYEENELEIENETGDPVEKYTSNSEEWYQQKDKDKIETLIYDLKQGKTVIETGCNNACTGTCGITCSGTMAAWYTPGKGDGENGCNGGCKNLCLNYCDIVCATSCGIGCGESCGNGCGIECQTGCGTTCKGGCGKDCKGDCEDSCGVACANSCGDGCGSGCQGSCNGACKGGCGGKCTGCYGDCGTNCTGQSAPDGASGWCVNATCTGECGVGCDNECNGSCGSACGGTCASSACTSSCGSTCTGCSGCTSTCGSGCTKTCDGCTGSCEGTCGYNCNTTCGDACKVQCGNQCETTCGTSCHDECQNSCQDKCNDSCKSTNASSSSTNQSSSMNEGCGNNCSTGCNIYCTGCSGNCAGLGTNSVENGKIYTGDNPRVEITTAHREMEWSSTSNVKYTGAKDGYAPGELPEDDPSSVRRTMDIDVSGGNVTPDKPSDGVNPLQIEGYTIINEHNPDYPHSQSTHEIPEE